VWCHGTWVPVVVRHMFANYTVSKKDTDVSHYNFSPHQPILVIFGTDVAKRVHYQKRIFTPPLLTNVSALPGETWTQEIIFSVMLLLSRKRWCLRSPCTYLGYVVISFLPDVAVSDEWQKRVSKTPLSVTLQSAMIQQLHLAHKIMSHNATSVACGRCAYKVGHLGFRYTRTIWVSFRS